MEPCWTLMAVRKSRPGDPTDARGPSRFIFCRGTEEEMRGLYNSYRQPTEVFLAELSDPSKKVVDRFDRVAEALSGREGQSRDLFVAVAGEAVLL